MRVLSTAHTVSVLFMQQACKHAISTYLYTSYFILILMILTFIVILILIMIHIVTSGTHRHSHLLPPKAHSEISHHPTPTTYIGFSATSVFAFFPQLWGRHYRLHAKSWGEEFIDTGFISAWWPDCTKFICWSTTAAPWLHGHHSGEDFLARCWLICLFDWLGDWCLFDLVIL